MGLFRYWRSGAAASLFLYNIATRALDFGGYVDFYLVHRAEPGWLGAIVTFALHPPDAVFWLSVPIGLALIAWDARRRIARIHKEVAQAPASPSILPLKQTAPLPAPSKAPVKIADAKEPTATVDYAETWEKPLRLDVLFSCNDLLRQVFLRFAPDTENPRADALLLLLFCYKKFYFLSEIPIALAKSSLKNSNLFLFDNIYVLSMFEDNDSTQQLVKKTLDGQVKVVGLSRGGYLQITREGYASAYHLAEDLISRA